MPLEDGPSWLDEDDGSRESIVTAPVVSPRTTQQGRQALEDAGLGFLCENEEDQPTTSPSPSLTPVAVAKKNGVLLEQDTFVAKSNTSAPVHFLKRMQKAEAEREVRVATKASLGAERTPAPPPRKGIKPPANRSRHNAACSQPINSGQQPGVAIGVQQEMAPVDLSIISELSDSDKTKHAVIIEALGELTVRKLVSARFQHRLQAQQELRDLIEEQAEDNNKEGPPSSLASDALVSAVMLGASDPVLHVANAAADSLKAFLAHAASSGSTTSMKDRLMQVAKELIRKLNEPKCFKHIYAALHELSKVSSIGASGIVSLVCAVSAPAGDPSTTSAAVEQSDTAPLAGSSGTTVDGVRTVTAKLDFAIQFLQAHKELLQDQWEPLMAFAVVHLNSSNNKVRRNAMALVTYLHPAVGKGLVSHLKDVNPSTVKLLMEQLGEVEVGTAEDLLNPTISHLDQVEHRQEIDDVAAFDADGALASLAPQDSMLVDMWSTTLGIQSAKCMYSSRWKLRERFVERMASVLAPQLGTEERSRKNANLKSTTVVACIAQIIEKALSDSVPPVWSAGLRTLKLLVPSVPPEHIWELLDGTIPYLVKHASSTQARDMVHEIVTLILKVPGVNTTRLFTAIAGIDEKGAELSKVQPKTLVARVVLLTCVLMLTAELDVQDTLTTERCIETACRFMETPNPKVRSAASAFVVELHSKVGSRLHPFLSKMSGTPALEELRSRIANASSKRNAKAQRLFNFVQPLADDANKTTSSHNGRDATQSIKQRILQHQEASSTPSTNAITPSTPVTSPTSSGRSASRVPGVSLASVSPSPATPGKKSRLVFA